MEYPFWSCPNNGHQGNKHHSLQSFVNQAPEVKKQESMKKEKVPDSKLPQSLQDLINLICDVKTMEDMVLEMKYDARKAPLGMTPCDCIWGKFLTVATLMIRRTWGSTIVKCCKVSNQQDLSLELTDHSVSWLHLAELLLTHCGLVTPYGDMELGQHWLRQWLVAWRHQAITWTNVDWSSVKSNDIPIKGKPGFFQVAKMWTNEKILPSSGESWYYCEKYLQLWGKISTTCDISLIFMVTFYFLSCFVDYI